MELDATFVDDNRIGGKFKAGLPHFQSDVLLKRIAVPEFSCTHKYTVKLAP